MSWYAFFSDSIVGSLRDREVACSASDRQGSNFESCVCRTVSSQSSHHPQEVLLAQFSLYVHKGGLKPDSFHFFSYISKTPSTPSPLDPRPSTHDPRPSTSIFSLFFSLFIKFGKQYQVNVGSLSAKLA